MQLDACTIAPSSWQRRPIKDVCRKVTSGGTPSRKNPSFYIDGSIGWVKTKELADGFISKSEERITPEAVATSSAKLLPKDTILLAMYGATVGMLGILNEEMACNQACCAMLVNDEVDRDFLFYQLLAHRNQLQGLATGAAQQNLSGQQIKEFVLPFPSLAEQKAIGSYLRLIDDRIALLHETNKTLESIAQALFKSWFVDFDPVRIRSEGALPEGMDEATAALFPDSFEETEFGLLPNGWRMTTLSEIANLNVATWLARNAPSEIAYVDLASVKSNVFDAPQSFLFSDAPSRARRILQSNDCIVGTVRPGNRSFGFIAQAENNLTASTGFAVLSPKQKDLAAFVYLCATRKSNIDRLASLADGGAYPAVKPELVAGTACVLASDVVMRAFDEIAKPILDSIWTNSSQSQTLTSLRDMLLPRLISGQLRIPHIEAELEGAIA